MVAAVAIVACSAPPLPSSEPLGGATDAGAGAGGGSLFDAGGPTGPPPADAGGLCGNDIHKVLTDPPNVYFVIDASGSMSQFAGAGQSRYERVHGATVEMVKNLGPLINVGAAIFPLGATEDDACHVGGEVFPMSPGDLDGDGPTTNGFAAATDVIPFGNTPTASSLAAIKSKVTALPGRTIVVLATDGAPNCNLQLTCSGSDCIPNIEGCNPTFQCCALGGNCCTPGGPAGPEACVDKTGAVDAIADLEAAGVAVHVIGIPGTQAYKTVLNQMALAGGAAQLSPPFFYEVEDLDNLGAVLGSIAAVVISCEFEIPEPPEDPNFTNVYLDKQLLKQDPKDGWIWKSETVVELRGAACSKLKSGQVKQVQIVSGCPTEATK